MTKPNKLFPHITPEELNTNLNKIIKDALGQDVNPEKFMTDMRIHGGITGPCHPMWWNLLASLGWNPFNYKEKYSRFKPSFFIHSNDINLDVPVFVENYAFIPSDKEDELANEAFNVISSQNEYALLLFKGMFYKEMDGLYWNHAGYLWLNGKFNPFTLNQTMFSFDDVLTQIKNAFSFDDPDPQYCDKNCTLTYQVSRLFSDLDPNVKGRAMKMTHLDGWSSIVCDDLLIQSMQMLKQMNDNVDDLKKKK